MRVIPGRDSVVIGFALSCFLLSLSPWSQFPLHLIYWLWVHCQQHNTIITSDSTHIMLSGLPRSSMYAVCTLLSHWDWKRLNVNGCTVGWVFRNSAVENVLCASLQRTTQTVNNKSLQVFAIFYQIFMVIYIRIFMVISISYQNIHDFLAQLRSRNVLSHNVIAHQVSPTGVSGSMWPV